MLATFIKEHTHQITAEWESFARQLTPASTDMSPLALRNHLREILEFVVSDMERPQSRAEQVEKSHGQGPQDTQGHPSAAETHAALRLAGGFNIDQMVSEFRALRASVLKLWWAARKEHYIDDMKEMIRFNEAIDHVLTESVSHYAKKLADSKDLFLGILSHDLRNPLGAIVGAAELIPKIGDLNDRQKALDTQITASAGRISEIVDHLLDITKARFGAGLSVVRSPMDMGFVARQLVDEMRVKHPERKFTLEISGETEGDWDKPRIGQVFSNLLGNAVQYSFSDSSIDVVVEGRPDDVVVSVHNDGVTIPPEKIARIFDCLTRATAEDKEHRPGEATRLGLGLYITREVVVAHGGDIRVKSHDAYGTTFTARFPRAGKTLSPENKIPDSNLFANPAIPSRESPERGAHERGSSS